MQHNIASTFTIHHSPSITHHPSLTIHHSPSITHHSSSFVAGGDAQPLLSDSSLLCPNPCVGGSEPDIRPLSLVLLLSLVDQPCDCGMPMPISTSVERIWRPTTPAPASVVIH